MTDNEIIKALGDYKNSNIIQTEKGVISIGDILDLINRIKSENEDLKADKEALINGQETLQKHIAEKNAEIERLLQKLQQTKSEAIKEFAEKVYRMLCKIQNWKIFKDAWLENGECYWLKAKFNNLVKELTE